MQIVRGGFLLDNVSQMCYTEATDAGGDTHHKKQIPSGRSITRGRIPIEKNIIVTDDTGVPIGATYPKRARGLVKHGRAAFTDDRTIRLLSHYAPTVQTDTEESKMSQILEFHARNFHIDGNAPSTVAERKIITLFGQNTELFVIGNWRWDWSQIVSAVTLEPQTEYCFRFALLHGMCNTMDETVQCIIVPEDNWDERYVYDLALSRYQPVISKAADGDLLRVFEIPIVTGACTQFRILFVSLHCETWIMPAPPAERCAELPDRSYAQWREIYLPSSQQQENGMKSAAVAINLSGAVISARTLDRLLVFSSSGGMVNLSGAVIEEDKKAYADDADSDDGLIEKMLQYLREGELTAAAASVIFDIEEAAAAQILGAMTAMNLAKFDSDSLTYSAC